MEPTVWLDKLPAEDRRAGFRRGRSQSIASLAPSVASQHQLLEDVFVNVTKYIFDNKVRSRRSCLELLMLWLLQSIDDGEKDRIAKILNKGDADGARDMIRGWIESGVLRAQLKSRQLERVKTAGRKRHQRALTAAERRARLEKAREAARQRLAQGVCCVGSRRWLTLVHRMARRAI